VTDELVQAINQYGFPIIAAMGLGYFVFYVWKWVTTEIQPILGEASSTLIKLVDRIRMLDNDMIRLNTKLSMVLEYRAKLNPQRQDELQRLVDEYRSSTDNFDTKGDKKNGK
jgi:site-specific recombinase